VFFAQSRKEVENRYNEKQTTIFAALHESGGADIAIIGLYNPKTSKGEEVEPLKSLPPKRA
jgi:hypothetical protein